MDRLRLLEMAHSEAYLSADARALGDFLRAEEEARIDAPAPAAPAAPEGTAYADALLSTMSAVRALDHGAGL